LFPRTHAQHLQANVGRRQKDDIFNSKKRTKCPHLRSHRPFQHRELDNSDGRGIQSGVQDEAINDSTASAAIGRCGTEKVFFGREFFPPLTYNLEL